MLKTLRKPRERRPKELSLMLGLLLNLEVLKRMLRILLVLMLSELMSFAMPKKSSRREPQLMPELQRTSRKLLRIRELEQLLLRRQQTRKKRQNRHPRIKKNSRPSRRTYLTNLRIKSRKLVI